MSPDVHPETNTEKTIEGTNHGASNTGPHRVQDKNVAGYDNKTRSDSSAAELTGAHDTHAISLHPLVNLR